MNHVIKCVDTLELYSIWPLILPVLKQSFHNVDFNQGFTVDTVVDEIEIEFSRKSKSDTRHLIAYSGAEIVGCVFSIQLNRKDEIDTTEVGWFFTSPTLDTRQRIKLATELITQTHDIVTAAGFEKIVTEIGTKGGERFLKKKFGYYNVSKSRDENKWESKLSVPFPTLDKCFQIIPSRSNLTKS